MSFFDFSTFSFDISAFFEQFKSFASGYVGVIRGITSAALVFAFVMRKAKALPGFIAFVPKD
jgi:hypothetical protein